MFFVRASMIILSISHFAFTKIYQRCELARELRNFDVPEDEIATWVCIVQHESNYDTAAMNNGSGDHGLFQISEVYWCSPPGYGCNTPCSQFRDEDIADDLRCIRRIFNEHKRISGIGFNAWVVYPLYCNGENSKYLQGCVEEGTTQVPENGNEIGEGEDADGDGYHFPPLPTYARDHQADDGYEFPKLPFREVSIHRFVSVAEDVKDVEKTPSRLPYSRTSIHFAIPVKKKEKLPFSKYSIHHFVTVPSTSTTQKYDVTEPDVTTMEITTTDAEDMGIVALSSETHEEQQQLPAVTTARPMARQVTFAPNSFFSWLFNSQTLPPILPPIRPPRPINERPSRPSTLRPPAPARPPPRPPGAGLSSIAPRPPQRRPIRPHRNPPRRPSSIYYTNIYNKNVTNGSEVNRSNNASLATDTGMGGDKGVVEVKLNDDVVFLRTKFGYRFHRTNIS